MRHFRPVLLAAVAMGLGAPQGARAESAADALLGATALTPGSQAASATGAIGSLTEVKISDSFMAQLVASWQAQKGLSYDLNAWVMKIVRGQDEDAAHLWTVIEPAVPQDFQYDAKAASAYLLWKLDLPQAFFNRWMELLRDPKFIESKAEFALEDALALKLDRWLLANAIFPTPEQEAVIATLGDSRGGTRSTLHALAALRKGEKGLSILETLPSSHALKIPLAGTVSLALARKGDLAGAGRVLKIHAEPAIEGSHDPRALSRHYLAVARLLYQAGALDGAEVFYQKIPSGTDEFLVAREELSWVWLRKGDTSRLRGELTTLSLRLFEEKFAPEVYLVRAISNLKLCFYDQAERDFEAFTKNNRRWAAEIQAALAQQDQLPAPARMDAFSRAANLALEKRAAEIARLEELSRRSIGAVLPAVGPQAHWIKARDQVKADLELARKRQAQEYRRQWNNQKTALTEAIRKMKFVKVELLTQLRMAAVGKPSEGSSDRIDSSSAAPLRKSVSESDMNFPFDGVVWADELFKLRSMARGRCLQAL